MILILLLLIFLLCLIGSWIYLLRDSKSYNIPGPMPLPIIGNGNLFLVDSSEFLQILSNLAYKFGDAYRVHILHHRYIVLSHPKYIEEIISSTETITKGKSYYFLRPWLGDGLLTSTGQKWKTHRKFLTPAFHYNILHSFLPVFLKNEKILSEQLKRRADGSLIELFPIFALAALDNIAESIMGVSFEAQKDRESKYVKAIDEASQIMATRMRNIFLNSDVLFALTPYKRLQDKALAVLHNHTKDVIEMRRQQLKNTSANKLNQNSEIGMKNKHAFLDLLLLAEVEGHGLDIESIRDEVETFMFEGHDTTASGLVYGLYCIAKHPEVQRKILEEQMEILGDDLERDPTFSELQQMKYLECVIKESLRLYPSVPIIERLITRDVGQKFAMLELKVTLAALVRRFKILPGKREPQPCGDLILRSQNGVQVKILPRN
ncbi:cytochrome P450 4d2-like isoform X3 [Choristoneura fumiferana]|uniref:cytochrome P450 4d2-like isoform X3 n=1 Tax=Choristoneura fumiferana TaxID=7141 RepID=UPI003D15EB3F